MFSLRLVFVPQGSLVGLWVVSVSGVVADNCVVSCPGRHALYGEGVRKRFARVEGVVYAGNDLCFFGLVEPCW